MYTIKKFLKNMVSTNSSFNEKRERMVRAQLIARDIVDKEVLRAMAKVPRHEFLPADLQDRAYDDTPLPIEEMQTISQPYIVAYMIQALSIKKETGFLKLVPVPAIKLHFLQKYTKKFILLRSEHSWHIKQWQR